MSKESIVDVCEFSFLNDFIERCVNKGVKNVRVNKENITWRFGGGCENLRIGLYAVYKEFGSFVLCDCEFEIKSNDFLNKSYIVNPPPYITNLEATLELYDLNVCEGVWTKELIEKLNQNMIDSVNNLEINSGS